MPDNALRSLPSVDRLLRSAVLDSVRMHVSHDTLTYAVREAVDEEREARRTGASARNPDDLLLEVLTRLQDLLCGERRVINATGVILHTNLGRAPLSDDALAAMTGAAGYGDLELDLISGERGSRQAHIGLLLRTLFEAEASLVVGSNAAAVLLSLTALARGRDVLVSRGQAVEIGGGFRVPSIMRQSGARLVEVGTTNRTRLSDFAEAISPRAGALLHVHASNFRIIGFTEAPAISDLATLAHRHDLPLLVDNGSGSPLDTARFGLSPEPMPRDALAAGADVVTFSGDKLLGGPQAGIILGRAELLAKLTRHPLARALRPDKLILAALAATLRAYLRGDAVQTVPVWQMIALTPANIARRAERLQEQAASRSLRLERLEGESAVGGGSLPGETLPTTLLALPRAFSAARLRSGPVPVVGRTQGGRVLLDLRTVRPEDEPALLDALIAAESAC